MSTENQQVKKRVIKKKINDVAIADVVTNDDTTDVPISEDHLTDDLVSFIPSSRVKNYISKEKLNKHVDSIISKIKDNENTVDLNSLLSEEVQSKLGSLIKQKEEAGEEININSLAVELLSKQKYKFSNTSFKVLSVFLDLLVEEITLNVMDEIIKNKKSIINLKYVFSSKKDSPLYKVYSTLPTFISEQNLFSKAVEDTVDESIEDEQPEDVLTHSINFEFYVRKICNNLKKNKEEYAKIKVSNNYQKFCSNLILEFLDSIAPMTSIILEVMTTKTITNLVFETILKLQLYNNPHMGDIMSELKKRLS